MTSRANEARSIRKRILDDLAAAATSADSRARASSHVDAPHPAIATLTVRRLLLACRGVGKWHARKMLHEAKVSGDRELGDLTDRERDALTGILEEPWPYEQPSAAPAAA